MRANHIQRHHVSLIVRQQHPQPPFADIIADVEFRLEGDALPGNRQAAYHLGVIAHDSAGNLHVMDFPLQAQRPAVERSAAQHVGQRVVSGQIFQRLRFAVFGYPAGRGYQHPAIIRRNGQRNKRGIVVIAVAKRDVHRVFKHVGPMIGKQYPQAQRRMPLAKIAKHAQKQIAPKVRRHGDL